MRQPSRPARLFRRVALVIFLLSPTAVPPARAGLLDVTEGAIDSILADRWEALWKNAQDPKKLNQYRKKVAAGEFDAIVSDFFSGYQASDLAESFLVEVLPDVAGPLGLFKSANDKVHKYMQEALEFFEDRKLEDFRKQVLVKEDPRQLENAYNDWKVQHINSATTYEREDALDIRIHDACNRRKAYLIARERVEQRRQQTESIIIAGLKRTRREAAEKAWEATLALEAAGMTADNDAIRRYVKDDSFRSQVARKTPLVKKPAAERPITVRAIAQVEETVAGLPPASFENHDPLPDFGALLSDAREAATLVQENQITAVDYRTAIANIKTAGQTMADRYASRISDSNSDRGRRHRADIAAAHAQFLKNLQTDTSNVSVYADTVARRVKEMLAPLSAAETPAAVYARLKTEEAALPQVPAWLGERNAPETLLGSVRQGKPGPEDGSMTLAEMKAVREKLLQGIQASMDRETGYRKLAASFEKDVKRYGDLLGKTQAEVAAYLDKNASLATLGGVSWPDYARESKELSEGNRLSEFAPFSDDHRARYQERRFAGAAQSADLKIWIDQNEAARSAIEKALAEEKPWRTLPPGPLTTGGPITEKLVNDINERMIQAFRPIEEASHWAGGPGGTIHGGPGVPKDAAARERVRRCHRTLAEYRGLLETGTTLRSQYAGLKFRERLEFLEKPGEAVAPAMGAVQKRTTELSREAQSLSAARHDVVKACRNGSNSGPQPWMESILESLEKRIPELEAHEKEALRFFNGLLALGPSDPIPPDFTAKLARYSPVIGTLPNLPYRSPALELSAKKWEEKSKARVNTPPEGKPPAGGRKAGEPPQLRRVSLNNRPWNADSEWKAGPEDLSGGQMVVRGSVGGRVGNMQSLSGGWEWTRLEVRQNRGAWQPVPLFKGDTRIDPWVYRFSPVEGKTTLEFRLANPDGAVSAEYDCPPLTINYSTVGLADRSKDNLQELFRNLEQNNVSAFMRIVSPDYVGGDENLRGAVREFLNGAAGLQIAGKAESTEVQDRQAVLQVRWDRRGTTRPSGGTLDGFGHATFVFEKGSGKLRSVKGQLPWVSAASIRGGEVAVVRPLLPKRKATLNEELAWHGEKACFDFSEGQIVDCGPSDDMHWQNSSYESPPLGIIAQEGLADLGSKEIDDITEVPVAALNPGAEPVRLVEGHTYALRTRERNYALMSVVSLNGGGPDSMTFEWKYQPDGSPKF